MPGSLSDDSWAGCGNLALKEPPTEFCLLLGLFPYSLEGLTLKLKLQSFAKTDLMRKTDSLEKTLMLGKIEGRKRGDDRG